MATIQAANIDDLVELTLRELNRNFWTQIAQRLQSYEISQRIFKKYKTQFESGYEVQYHIMVDHSDAAKMVGLYNVDDVDVPSLAQKITIPFRHTTTSWPYDVVEMSMNSGVAKINSVIKMRHDASIIALTELIETQGWGEPSSSSDDKSIYGFKYWLVANSSTGFNGGNNTNFSSGPGGLNSTTYPRWKNYTAQYVDITRTDLMRKMKIAFNSIKFEAPQDVSDFRKGRGNKMRIYMSIDNLTEVEELAENQNDRLGSNLASMDGKTTLRGIPMTWVPKLDGVTSPTNPIYMINFDHFFPMCLKSNFMRQTGPIPSPKQHNVREIHLDLTWNMVCNDRRRQAVLVTAT